MKKNSVMLALVSVLLLIGSVARGTLIIQDDFSRGTVETPVALNGSTSTVNTVSGTPAWLSGGWMTDGSQAIIAPTNSRNNAVIPLSITAGKTYTLSANVDALGGVGYVGLGFVTSLSTTGNFYGMSATPASGIYFSNAGIVRRMVNNVNQANQTGFGTGSYLFKVVLDTTAPEWTMSFFCDDVSLGVTNTFAVNPAFIGVGIGVFDSAASVDNFTVSVIPEPASVSLLVAGGLLVALLRHRVR